MTRDERDKVNAALRVLNAQHAGRRYSGSVYRFAELTGRSPESIRAQLGTVSGQRALALELGTYPRSHFLALLQ